MIEEKQRIIPMIYDVVFKSVLQDKESEDYLIDIISNITGIKKDYMKGNIVFKNSELPKNNIKEKGKATDLIVELKENIINLEMNKNYYEGLYDKNDGYLDKIKDGVLTMGQTFPRRRKIIQINFDNFEVFDERIIIKFVMMDVERGLIRSDYVYSSDIEIYHVNLKKIRKMYYNKDKLNKFEKELLLMTIDDEKELNNISKGCKEMENVVKKISKVSKEEELQGIYDIEERQEFIQNRIREYAKEEGYDEGLKEGMDFDIIEKITKISKEELEKLNNGI